MPSNSTGTRMREFDAAYPGQLGHLFSTRPEGGDGWFIPWLPYAIDGLQQFLTEWKAGHRSRPHGSLFDDEEAA